MSPIAMSWVMKYLRQSLREALFVSRPLLKTNKRSVRAKTGQMVSFVLICIVRFALGNRIDGQALIQRQQKLVRTLKR